RAREWFVAGDPDTRREILQAIGSNFVLRDRILTIEANIPFRLIDGGLASLRSGAAGFEPPNSGLTMRDLLGLEGSKNRMWAFVEDVRTFYRNDVGSERVSHAVSALIMKMLGHSPNE